MDTSLLMGQQQLVGKNLISLSHKGKQSALHMIGIQMYPLKDQMNQWMGMNES